MKGQKKGQVEIKLPKFSVSVLLTKEGETWAVRGIEYDLAAQGRTIKEAKLAFERTFVSKILRDLKAGKRPFENIPDANGSEHEVFRSAAKNWRRT